MVRIALSLYLMASAAAGPWLCCCTFQRVTAFFLPPTKNTTADHGGCCGCHSSRTDKPSHDSTERRSEDREHPGRPSCPCQDDKPQPASVDSLDSEAAASVQPRFLFGASVLMPAGALQMSCVMGAEGGLTAGEGVTVPFRAPADILDRFHMLRC